MSLEETLGICKSLAVGGLLAGTIAPSVNALITETISPYNFGIGYKVFAFGVLSHIISSRIELAKSSKDKENYSVSVKK